MKEQVYDMSSYKLHLIKTDKFKTTRIYFFFRNSIKRENMTARNFLCDMLLDSTNNLKTPREITIKSEELYSAYIYSANRRMGNYLVSSFVLSCLDDKYTEEGNFNKAFELFKDIVFNPNIENNAFEQKRFDVIKPDIKTEIESIKQNKSKYSLIRALEESGEENYSIREYGYLEDLEGITPSSLYETYKSMIKSDILDVVVIGDFEFNEMKDYIKNNIKINTIKKDSKDIYFKKHDLKKRIKKTSEISDVEQAKVAIILKLDKLTKFEKNYVLKIYNHILGGSGFRSLLFDVIREKHSLAYSIFSSTSSLDNLIYSVVGLESKNVDKAYKLFRTVINKMKKVEFEDRFIEEAKAAYIKGLKEDMDFATSIVSNYYFRSLTGGDTFEEKISEMNKVTKEDVKKIAKKVYLDTMFLLWEGDGDAKEKN